MRPTSRLEGRRAERQNTFPLSLFCYPGLQLIGQGPPVWRAAAGWTEPAHAQRMLHTHRTPPRRYVNPRKAASHPTRPPLLTPRPPRASLCEDRPGHVANLVRMSSSCREPVSHQLGPNGVCFSPAGGLDASADALELPVGVPRRGVRGEASERGRDKGPTHGRPCPRSSPLQPDFADGGPAF